jgi:hypothetical protein
LSAQVGEMYLLVPATLPTRSLPRTDPLST